MNNHLRKFACVILLTLCVCDLSSSSKVISTDVEAHQISSVAVNSDTSQAEMIPPTFKLSPEQLVDYKRDGYVVIRGLLSGQELRNAIKTAKKLNRIPLVQRLFNMLFKFNDYRQVSFQTWKVHKSMEHVAFDSSVPSITAQLMDYAKFDDHETETSSSSSSSLSSLSSSSSSQCSQNPPAIRLLRDAFLAYEDGGRGCGWHVDDKFFWPCEDSPPHTADAGVNVWITLSPLRASEGGGLAIAPTTHAILWREDARAVIASPGNGMPQTCELEKLSPEFHGKVESLKKGTIDMQPGDAIIHDRYLFHRADKFQKERKLGFLKRTKYRISLRYMPAKAGVFVMENMVQDKGFSEKDMKTGDALEKGEEYFPQVWPTSLKKERGKKLKHEESFITWGRLLKMFKNMKETKKKKKTV